MSALSETLREAAVLALVSWDDPKALPPLVSALSSGGVRAMEVTLRSPHALAVLAAAARCGGLLVGAGTVVDVTQVDAAVEAGAGFLVCPGLSVPVLRRARELGVAVLPGVATASEVMLAMAEGLDAVKLFPAAQLGGPAMIRALAGPFPGIGFVPTGGVDAGSAPTYLGDPAVLAVGGSWLAPASAIRAADWDGVAQRAAEAVAMAAQARQAAT
jgi:2-dehydro-3-deoxyphosphogluconate aldolase / (4S)-4-hydroxy-2-oxoglutarate aldolase